MSTPACLAYLADHVDWLAHRPARHRPPEPLPLVRPARRPVRVRTTPQGDIVSPADCPFCLILQAESPATILAAYSDAIVIEPLGQVTEGHALVIPAEHVEDFTSDPAVSAAAMSAAAQYAASIGRPCNLITSKGREATQSVFHLHLHIVPRAKDDGLALPWHSGKGGNR